MKYLKLLLILFLLLVVYLVYTFARSSIYDIESSRINMQTVYDYVELKSQNDFQLIGEQIYTGSGFEPGFSFQTNVAGNKFGTVLQTQEGDKYVGYLDLVYQSTSSKILFGQMLDASDKVVTGEFKLDNKKCLLPSGDTTELSSTIKIGSSTYSGCASVTK